MLSANLYRPPRHQISALIILVVILMAPLTLSATQLQIHWQGHHKLSPHISNWLQLNTRNITRLIGYFPDTITIELIPAEGHYQPWKSPVPFGEVIRTLPEGVRFYIYPQASAQAFFEDWTASHEFSHLLLPYLGYSNRWISEGFASYYQNVLMAKMGAYSPQKAWQKLLAGIERAHNESPNITPAESPYIGMGKARMMIYWAGAAMALQADIKIRALTHQKQSLNSVLGDLQRCCLPTLKTWSAEQLFSRLDQFLPKPILFTLWQQVAFQSGPPDIKSLLEQLGLDNKGNVINPNASLALTRTAIMAPFH